uniref:Acid sphingomyelinase-like phosphodiesterase 3b n=1 Tax=Trichogramma kaykai TaxID=54128 RepID=A0ABD2W3D3_9HYME
MFRDYVVLLSWLCTVSWYFWHIGDIHYDPTYSIQSNGDGSKCLNSRGSEESNGGGGGAGHSSRLNGRGSSGGLYGHYDCDSSWALVDSAAKAMKGIHLDSIEFILWTGDALARDEEMPLELRMQYLKNITDLLSHTFTGQFIFPVLGHDDVRLLNLSQIASLWSNWLPDEALVTLREYGYYMIEQRSKNYQIISLNTNLWLSGYSSGANVEARTGASSGYQRSISNSAQAAASTDPDPGGQWKWLDSVLRNASKAGKIVYIVGHTPPGVDDRNTGFSGLSDEHNAHYLQVVRQYSNIIKGQFFGHWHSDTFRIVYDDNNQPVSWIMISPSITPYRPGGPNNPGLRLYKFNIDSGEVLDYSQYYLNLAEANLGKRTNWRLEYNLREHYELAEVSALSLHDLADRFTQPNNHAFSRYYKANRVSLPRDIEEIWGCDRALSGLCALRHFCAVTRLNQRSYDKCVATYTLVLTQTGAASDNTPDGRQLVFWAVVSSAATFFGAR